MNHDVYDDEYISGILSSIAIVGASANMARPSFFVTRYLIDKGYEGHPANPGRTGREIAGRTTFPTLGEVSGKIDMVDIFRPSDAVPAIVDEVLALAQLPNAVWMQLTIGHDEAAKKLEPAGMSVVMNRCPKIEYARLAGEIGWNGVNSSVISSKKPRMREGFQSFGIRRD